MNTNERYKSPVYAIRAVPMEKIKANEYNPNHVAPREMKLLYQSIKADGYTMPIVCIYNDKQDEYIIVDGFHRWLIMFTYDDIREREQGLLPVSVIDKDISDRMAATVRHNRARGKHHVELQAALVAVLKEDWHETKIMRELGMTTDEIQRLVGLRGIMSEIKGIPYSNEKQIVEAGVDIVPEDD
jgi:ParB-like chromosome segregation protein Spo0J